MHVPYIEVVLAYIAHTGGQSVNWCLYIQPLNWVLLVVNVQAFVQ